MEDLLKHMVRAAASERSVVVQELTNGMQLLAYPLEKDVMIGIGYCRGTECRLTPDVLVQRRSNDMARYGAWQPTMFADSTLHVVYRLTELDAGAEELPISTDELMRAVELMT